MMIKYKYKNVIPKDKVFMLNTEIEKGWQDMMFGRYRDSKSVFKDLKKDIYKHI